MKTLEIVRENGFDRKLFNFLLFINIIAGLIQIPYDNILSGRPALEYGKLLYIIPIQILWTTIIFTFPISIGINLSLRYAYEEPFFRSFLYKENYPHNTRKVLTSSFLIGIGLGISVLALLFISGHFLSISEHNQVSTPSPIWGIFASISAGIREESIFRFCILLVFIWLGRLFVKNEYIKSPNSLFWIANLLSGILFGAVHIFNFTAMNLEISLVKISVVISLNCILGMGFGYVFFKYGLLCAMLSHFASGIVLHVIFPMAK